MASVATAELIQASSQQLHPALPGGWEPTDLSRLFPGYKQGTELEVELLRFKLQPNRILVPQAEDQTNTPPRRPGSSPI